MSKKAALVVALLTVQLWGCANQQSLTKAERETQSRADAAVAGILFESDLNEAASYKVRKDGFVMIEFAGSVPQQKYTDVVKMLRSSPEIHGVRAEQEGQEVCPLRIIQ